ncbi:hypothetical protein [Ruminococcus bicirculans (ex Wegman et al. 2014)]|jgi:hypothetical protein|uniref:hypothetical protein n=1 Tax=Ruminococcus bicirculans (ex Wegman et al. 2014) TaxID=1160721 RepID=UPI00242E3BF0|nr:hypothetical protein [Ruminococcus bicirculans (ex Wegman et al. 2014)]
MNFNKCLKTQLYKMLISPVPVICAIMIFGLCCITNVYTDADGGKGYSVLTILLLRDPTEAVEGNSVVRENIIRAAMSSWLIMFSPVVCVLPFVKSVSAENSSLKRFEMQRSGKIAFAASRLVSAVLTSAAVLCLGYGLFVIFTVIMFPSVMDTNSHSAAAVLHSMSIGCFYLSRMAGAFIIGVLSALPAYIISVFSRNKYMMTCIPFMFFYFYNTLINRLSKGFSANVGKIVSLFSFNGIFRAIENGMTVYVILATAVLMILAAIIGVSFLQRRYDCCE